MKTTVVKQGRIYSETLSYDGFSYNPEDCIACPALADLHVHFREPGQEYKETIRTGSMAAAHGGYSLVCPMPNLVPVPDSPGHLAMELDIIKSSSVVEAVPYASITLGRKGRELVDMEKLAPYVAGFSDDGSGIADRSLMHDAMNGAKALDKIITAHCEDTAFQPEDARSEWSEVERDCELSLLTGARLHICHVSSKESIEIIRQAKKSGTPVTCETAPHYLTLTKEDRMPGGRFTMNPPLRSAADRDALLTALADGTIDAIATDHAPHSAQEKAAGANGIVGLETAFPVLFTCLCKKGIIPVEKLVDLMSGNPRRIFGFPDTDDIVVFDVTNPYIINPGDFLSKGRSTPFEGWKVFGRCLLTVHNGKIIWQS